MTIFDLIQSQEITAYWETLSQDRTPYVGEELFPAQKKLGLDLKWIKGSKGLPIVLKTSAFDVNVIPRERIGFDKMTAQMPFFKESLYIDEELRQELNLVLETGNTAYIDSIMFRVFDDQTALLEGAAAARERMRMMALTSGAIAMSSNGQSYVYDYGVSHKGTVSTSWSNPAANVTDDVLTAINTVVDDTGVRPSRAICNRKTWGYLLKNESILKSIFVITNGTGILTDARLRQYLLDELELDVIVNDKRYQNEQKIATKYVPDDTFVVFPDGNLGNTWFGTTPEESDLLSSSAANVSIADVGVAVTTMEKTDPVNVETKVSQICLPSFEAADQVYILDVIA